ncbi:helix-turn-helix domain-containing protein [Eubacteriales bacterium OttesenSCG-928-A19]|nr:helix-turn-helix domain-containing protein [Eubacteriales bacterium OttesenSCG-928-A19]
MDTRHTLDVNGLMEYLGTGRNNAQALMRRDDFPSVRISARRRIVTVKALEKWLAEQAGKKMNDTTPIF